MEESELEAGEYTSSGGKEGVDRSRGESFKELKGEEGVVSRISGGKG